MKSNSGENVDYRRQLKLPAGSGKQQHGLYSHARSLMGTRQRHYYSLPVSSWVCELSTCLLDDFLQRGTRFTPYGENARTEQ